MPWQQESIPYRIILLDSSVCDLLPGHPVRSDRVIQLVVSGRVDIGQLDRGGSSSAVEGMGEGLVLGGRRIGWVGGGEICALEICGGKVCDCAADSCGEFSDGFLDLDGIVVCLGLVDAGDPGPTTSAKFNTNSIART